MFSMVLVDSWDEAYRRLKDMASSSFVLVNADAPLNLSPDDSKLSEYSAAGGNMSAFDFGDNTNAVPIDCEALLKMVEAHVLSKTDSAYDEHVKDLAATLACDLGNGTVLKFYASVEAHHAGIDANLRQLERELQGSSTGSAEIEDEEETARRVPRNWRLSIELRSIKVMAHQWRSGRETHQSL